MNNYLHILNIMLILLLIIIISGYKKLSKILIGILLIIFIFIFMYNKMTDIQIQQKENYIQNTTTPTNIYTINYKSHLAKNNLDEMITEPIQNYVSWNHKLIGKANPKFEKEAPIIPRSHDLDLWASNPFIVHSHINDSSRIDLNQSGYNVQNKYPTNYFPIDNNLMQQSQKQHLIQKSIQNPIQTYQQIPTYYPKQKEYKEPYIPQYNNYDTQLRTQTIQPNVYSRNMVNEPIQTAIGISYAQQFEPTFYDEENNKVLYTEIDSDVTKAIAKPRIEKLEPTIENVYDPRFVGYGSEDRYYEEPVTGQPRYMYDDINAVRQPNYITRNNIDFIDRADSYGSLNSTNAYGNIRTCEMRGIANDAFLHNSIQQRTDLQERLMRKANARMYQRRIAPIRQF